MTWCAQTKKSSKTFFPPKEKISYPYHKTTMFFKQKNFKEISTQREKVFFFFFLKLIKNYIFFKKKIVFFIITRKNNFPNKEFLILKVFYFYPILIIVSETFFSLCNIFLYLISLCFSSSVRVLYHSCPYYLFFSFSSLEKL